MAENSLPQVGCSDVCPIGPYIQEAFGRELARIDDTYKVAQAEVSDTLEDFGDLSIAEFEKNYSTRMLRAQALEYQEVANDCDGVHCKLAAFLVEKLVDPPR